MKKLPKSLRLALLSPVLIAVLTGCGNAASANIQAAVLGDSVVALPTITGIYYEKGLYIEGNMRDGQPESTGIVASTGRNPNAELSMSFPALVRYLGEKYGNVMGTVELAKIVNVYDMITDEFARGRGYFVADASGHYGVLMLIDNKPIGSDG